MTLLACQCQRSTWKTKICGSPCIRLFVAVLWVTTIFAANWNTTYAADIDANEPSIDGTFFAKSFTKYCVHCHDNDGNAEANVDLASVDGTADLLKRPQLVRKLIDVLDRNEMPPEDEEQPEQTLRRQLLSELKKLLHQAVANTPFNQVPMRRMNRFQYNNAVVDLLDLNTVVFTLPERMLREHGDYFQPASGKMPDTLKAGSRPLGKSQLIERRLAGVAPFPQDLRAEHGFDNRGDHLSLSPLLLESFLGLGRSIINSPDFGPKTCGIWFQFFTEPAKAVKPRTAIRRRLRHFLTLAFRRPVEEPVLDRYTKYALSQIAAGKSFTDSMKDVATAALASPRFFYLYERTGANQPVEPLDDFELASRLSFFLWGSLPDTTLMELAEQGTLRETDVLSQQVDRMLKDRKLKRFCDSFPAQWLQLDRIIASTPDREKFPNFYFSKYRDSMHMMLEPLLLFETVLIENKSILQFIDSDFSYRTVRLERYYSGTTRKGPRNPVTTLPFERVSIIDRREGGVITNAAVMTMTSGPERTKPITRGAWLATVIFNAPPEPPPADVPPLEEVAPQDESHLTLRERLSVHRERADCAGCHEKIDPLGFALENYGPTGRWRDTYENGRKVDMNGILFREHEFNDVIEFKDALLAEKTRFTRGFASHMLSFALARELGVADSPALDVIVRRTEADGYRIQRLIRETVLSKPFRSKSNALTPANVATKAALLKKRNQP